MGAPVRVENEANVEALAEATFGAARDAEIAVHVKMVGGVGAGVIVHRRLIRGANGYAGELAHLHLDDDGPMCLCGGRGCLATSAALYQIVGMFHPAFDAGKALERLIALSAQQDAPTLRLLHEVGRTLGRGLGTACVVLNPDVITIDGRLGDAVHPILEGVREGIASDRAGAGRGVTLPPPGCTGRNGIVAWRAGPELPRALARRRPQGRRGRGCSHGTTPQPRRRRCAASGWETGFAKSFEVERDRFADELIDVFAGVADDGYPGEVG